MTHGGQFCKLTLRDIPLRNKTVLLRVDYNVPLTKNGKVIDDYRIRSSLPTIKKLRSYGCKVVIISHLGRPNGVHNKKYSLEPAAERLASLLAAPVRFVDDCVGYKVKMAIKRAPSASITVLENLRFYAQEEANDTTFAKRLASDSGADYFIQDGFGVVHRAHASTVAITQYLPSVAGLLLEREYLTITKSIVNPARPVLAIIGGAKISDKLPIISAMISVADTIAIGGALANTILAHKGYGLGASKIEQGQEPAIESIYTAIANTTTGNKAPALIVLPQDLGVGTSLAMTATRKDVSINGVGTREMALDIGPKTTSQIISLITTAGTVLWNGPLGYSEVPAFAKSSVAIASALASNPRIVSIIGGGDTADFAIKWDKKSGKSFTHVSTGGGASLELMSGALLPGVESLMDAH
ncbi:phosphoglycerate kinase [Candidatus Saccharibacteria bacterium]|nr:phosphoglycerate kinase [Candidatus Saccharibacteria bacterium]